MSIVNSLNFTCVRVGKEQLLAWMSWVSRHGRKQLLGNHYHMDCKYQLECISWQRQHVTLFWTTKKKWKYGRFTNVTSKRFYTVLQKNLQGTYSRTNSDRINHCAWRNYTISSLNEISQKFQEMEKFCFVKNVISKYATILVGQEAVPCSH